MEVKNNNKKMENPYYKNPIYGYKSKFSLFSVIPVLCEHTDFTPEESNKIIENWVKQVEQYEQRKERIMHTEYEKVMTLKGERIIAARMRSIDDVIDGTFEYRPPVIDIWTENNTVGYVTAEFNFNSKKESDKQDYLDLYKIVGKSSHMFKLI
ncbi:MAG: hypothetical protein NT129_06635 [Candidatus Aenigmarchaeota archaeon]|nr:hypothetical protein [Candidatus Aenigmarchaeota archaeon]